MSRSPSGSSRRSPSARSGKSHASGNRRSGSGGTRKSKLKQNAGLIWALGIGGIAVVGVIATLILVFAKAKPLAEGTAEKTDENETVVVYSASEILRDNPPGSKWLNGKRVRVEGTVRENPLVDWVDINGAGGRWVTCNFANWPPSTVPRMGDTVLIEGTFDDSTKNTVVLNRCNLVSLKPAEKRTNSGTPQASDNRKTNAGGNSDLETRVGVKKNTKVPTGRRLRLLRTHGGHAKYITQLALSPDGSIFASADTAGDVRVWNVRTGQLLQTLKATDVRLPWPMTMKFSFDNRLLCLIRMSGPVEFWDVEKGTIRTDLARKGSRADAIAGQIAFSPDGKVLAITRADNTEVHLWSTSSNKTLAVFPGTKHHYSLSGLCFSPDGTLLASALPSSRSCLIWDIANRRLKTTLKPKPDNRKRQFVPHVTLAFAKNGKELEYYSTRGDRQIWDIESGRILTSEKQELTMNDDDAIAVTAIGTVVPMLRWGLPDDRTMSTIVVRYWDPDASASKPPMVSERIKRVNMMRVTPDGRTLIVGHSDPTVTIWDISDLSKQ